MPMTPNDPTKNTNKMISKTSVENNLLQEHTFPNKRFVHEVSIEYKIADEYPHCKKHHGCVRTKFAWLRDCKNH